MKLDGDTNGLVDGNIPAGNPCPFLKECFMIVDGCPTASNPKKKAFSCAAARLHSQFVNLKAKQRA